MPHATNMPSPGFQAIILCGPGASLSTFTAKPEDFPKAIIPIANRPMVWYALDYCYRMGISLTPPVSARAIEDTLNTNPHLTSLPAPKPDIIAPKDLTHESGTADALRQPEVRKVITGDFVVLPCDIVSEVPGETFLEAWMIQQDDLNGASSGVKDDTYTRDGGLGVWYPTKGEQAIKGEETDFVVTAALPNPTVSPPERSVRSKLEQIMVAMPSDTLGDILEEQKSLSLRPALLRKAGKVKMRTSCRDAHIYVFPHWVIEMVRRNSEMESVSEDVVGNWVKATWQDGFGDKLGLRQIFEGETEDDGKSHYSMQHHDEVDVVSMCSTRFSDLTSQLGVQSPKPAEDNVDALKKSLRKPKLDVPPFLGYIHPQAASGLLIRRVDTAAMLLNVSLHLAKLEAVEEAGHATSPLAHNAKIANPGGIAQRCTVTKADCLLAENVQVEEKCVVKESVIGANCVIKTGARLTRCLLMDEVVIGEKCQLTDCVIGRRAQIGKDSVLKECRVQDGNAVPEETDSKGEDIMVFEGLDGDGDFDAEAEDLGEVEGDEVVMK